LAEVFATIGPLSSCKLFKRNKVVTNSFSTVYLALAKPMIFYKHIEWLYGKH
jgi:hypothetical protein